MTYVGVCPVDCIHELERMLIIDPEECIDCGACEQGFDAGPAVSRLDRHSVFERIPTYVFRTSHPTRTSERLLSKFAQTVSPVTRVH